jgi:hypothetical protein
MAGIMKYNDLKTTAEAPAPCRLNSIGLQTSQTPRQVFVMPTLAGHPACHATLAAPGFQMGTLIESESCHQSDVRYPSSWPCATLWPKAWCAWARRSGSKDLFIQAHYNVWIVDNNHHVAGKDMCVGGLFQGFKGGVNSRQP